MIKYRAGGLYLIFNVITMEHSYIQPSEAIFYQGHVILYGLIRPHVIRTYRGPQELDGTPTAFPCISYERHGEKGAAALGLAIKATGGDDGTGRPWGQWRIAQYVGDAQEQAVLRLDPEAEAEPLYRIGGWCAEMWGGKRYKEGWSGLTINRDGMINASRRALDLYEDIVRLGHMPNWFRAQRVAALNVAPQLYR